MLARSDPGLRRRGWFVCSKPSLYSQHSGSCAWDARIGFGSAEKQRSTGLGVKAVAGLGQRLHENP